MEADSGGITAPAGMKNLTVVTQIASYKALSHPIYGMYNPILKHFRVVHGFNCKVFHLDPPCFVFVPFASRYSDTGMYTDSPGMFKTPGRTRMVRGVLELLQLWSFISYNCWL